MVNFITNRIIHLVRPISVSYLYLNGLMNNQKVLY